nr:protein FAR1-RELATED SEQUENCE 5-like [Ziziphus jujuba var. spinosa]
MDNDSYVSKDINMSSEDEDKKDEGNITGQEKIEAIHSKILDEIIPKVGIEFKSEDEAYNFYNAYAYKRKLTFVQAAEIDIANSSGIAPKASLELMAKRVGGYENLGFIRDDYKNYLKTKRTIQMKVGETGGVLEYLQSMQLEDLYLFYAIQVDQDDLIRVNHHKQTTIFGAALLNDESAETFIWLFDTFVKAMSGKKPKTILTDQDPAMAKALTSQWPETCHRLCIWHLYQNAAKHLSGVFAKFREFAKDFSSCIYDYEEEQEFFLAWNAMLEKYDLKDNDWIVRMFDLRKKWALVYGRETFCADMTTTQRSESMNNVIKNYVSYQHNLLRFFEHFQRLIEDRRYEELKADFKATQSTPSLSFPVEILKDAASIYTPTIFKVFQDELCKAYDCAMQIFDHIGT